MIKTIGLSCMLSLMASESFAFYETFDSLSPEKWNVSTWESPPSGVDSHSGSYIEQNVEIVEGHLRLKMIQYFDGVNFVSYGGEISSLQEFSYGTFEFRMRASSTSDMPNVPGSKLEGSVSAAFLYATEAVTEIDIEFEGNNSTTHLISWIGENRKNQHTPKKLEGDPAEQFHIYKFVWKPGKIEYYRDDILIGTHTKKVPEVPAKMFFNHWGTHSDWWGGYATTDVPRYVYIDWFRYTPLPN